MDVIAVFIPLDSEIEYSTFALAFPFPLLIQNLAFESLLTITTTPYANDQIQQLRFGNTADRTTQKEETYATQEIVDHIKILSKRSKERAAAISTVIKSGNTKIRRSKIYECLNKAERDADWVADRLENYLQSQ